METIQFTESGGEATLTYSRSFGVRWGIIGWIFASLRVNPLFDRAVSEHLRDAKQIAEQRARRSHVHPGTMARGK